MESSLYEKPKLKRQRSPQEYFKMSRGLFHHVVFPFTTWLLHYKIKDNLLWDLQAGLVVGILLIPQGMAYGVLANLSPIYGLYCAIVPNIVYALMGTSRESAVGAAALVSIMLGDAINAVSDDPQPSLEIRIDIAIKLAFVTGIIQIILGMLKMGELASLVSHPVMSGFCSGGEILIAVAQLKYMFGIKVPQYPYAFQTLAHLCNHISETKPWTFFLGSMTFIILYSISKWRRNQKARIEKLKGEVSKTLKTIVLFCNFGPFCAIIITSFIAYGMDQRGVGPDVVGNVPQGMHMFTPYKMSSSELHDIFPQALILAIISYLLTFAVSLKYASLARYSVDPSQELIAVGLGDTIGSCFGAFLVAGGFARTAVNVEAGAKTQLASLVSACIVILAVSLLTKSFYWIPQVTLAAIVQVAICGIMDFTPFFYAYKTSPTEFTIMTITFIITLALGVDKGIMAGVGLSIIALVRRTSHPRLKILGRIPGTQTFRDVTRYPQAEQAPGILILRADESLNFASCASIKEQIIRAASGKKLSSPVADIAPSEDTNNNKEVMSMSGVPPPVVVLAPPPNCGIPPIPPHYVILDCSGMNHIDLSGIRALEEVHQSLARGDQVLYMVNVKSNVRDKVKCTGLFEKVGGDLIFLSLPTLLTEIAKKEEEMVDSNWVI